MDSFVLSDKFVELLSNLKLNYEAKKNIPSLEKAPRPYNVTMYMGATDVDSRLNQIRFIEGLCQFLTSHYHIKEDIYDPSIKMDDEAIHFRDIQRINALRCLVIACKFIKSNTSSGSELNALINEALGVTDKNPMDNATLAMCYKSSTEFLKSGDLLDKINAYLIAGKKEPLSIDLYRDFCEYARDQSELKRFASYKVSHTIYPWIVNPFKATGYAAGAMGAEFFSRSTSLVPANTRATAAIGSMMMLLGGDSARRAVFFMAPTLAATFVTNYLTIGLAWICGHAMGLVGSALALAIGVTADSSIMVLTGSGRLAYKLLAGKNQDSGEPSGICLLTGQAVCNGAILGWTHDDQLNTMECLEISLAEPQDMEYGDLESSPGGTLIAKQRDPHTVLPYMDELKKQIMNQETLALSM